MTEPIRPPGRGDAGFSLVELMIALVVISIGVLALSAVQTRSQGDVYSTGRQSSALALAQQQIEITRSAGFTNAASGTGQSGPYTWTTQVDSVAFELKQVNTTVAWTEGGTTQSLQLQTLLSVR